MAEAITYPEPVESADGRAIKIDRGCFRVIAQATSNKVRCGRCETRGKLAAVGWCDVARVGMARRNKRQNRFPAQGICSDTRAQAGPRSKIFSYNEKESYGRWEKTAGGGNPFLRIRVVSYGFAAEGLLVGIRFARGPCPQTCGAKSTSGERFFSRAHRRETSPLRRAPGATGPGGRS